MIILVDDSASLVRLLAKDDTVIATMAKGEWSFILANSKKVKLT